MSEILFGILSSSLRCLGFHTWWMIRSTSSRVACIVCLREPMRQSLLGIDSLLGTHTFIQGGWFIHVGASPLMSYVKICMCCMPRKTNGAIPFGLNYASIDDR